MKRSCGLLAALLLWAGMACSEDLTEIPVAESPTVAIRVVIEAGSADDPVGLEGLCLLTMRATADGGTPALTRNEVIERLDPMAADVELWVDRETTVFSGRCRREDLAEYFPIFWDRTFRPRFDPVDVERLREAALSDLENDLRGSDDERLGKEALQAFLFERTRWEHPPTGTESGLKAMSVEDLRAFHRKMVMRPRVHVGIAGGYDGEFAERLRAAIAAIPLDPAPADEGRLDPAPIRGLELRLVEKPARATAISIGFPHDVRRGDPDYWPLTLAVTAFGEHRTFLGRLQREMRSTRGLNYGNYAYLEHFTQDGWFRYPRLNLWRQVPYFSIWIRPVQPANGLFALRQAIWELRHLIDEGLTQQEFETTRDHLRNVSLLWKQTLMRRLAIAMEDAHLGRGDMIEELAESLDGMTLADANAALERRVTGENLKAVLVCAEADSIRELVSAGTATPIVYSGGDAPEAVKAKDARIAAMPLAATRVETLQAKEIFR